MLDDLERLRHELETRAAELGPRAVEKLADVLQGLDRLAFAADLPGVQRPEPLSVRVMRREKLIELSLAATLAQPDLLAIAARLTAEGIEAEFTKVLELLPDGDLLVRGGHGWPPGFVGSVRDVGNLGSQAGYTMMTGSPVAIEDLRLEHRFAVPDSVLQAGAVSSITALIPGKHRPYGVLQADSKRVRHYTAGEVRFIRSAAAMIGAAISLARADRALKLQESVASVLSLASDSSEAARLCVRAIGEALDFQTGSIWLLDSDGGVMRFRDNWSAPGFENRYTPSRAAVTKGVGMAGRVWEQGTVLWSTDVARDPRFLRPKELAAGGLASCVAVPVSGRDGVLAVILMFKSQPFEPDGDMIATLSTVAHQLGGFMERTQAESRLFQREREFRALVESSPDFIGRLIQPWPWRWSYLNPAAKRLLGDPLPDFDGPDSPINPEDDKAARKAVEEAFELGEERAMEMRYATSNGEVVLDVRLVPQFGENGAVSSLLFVGRDITEMKRAQLEANTRYEQIRALVEAAPMGMIVADARTDTVILANREFERLVNRRRRPGDPLVGGQRRIITRRPDGTVVPLEELPFYRALREREFVQAEEGVIEHPDGLIIPCITTAAPVLDSEGKVVAAITVLQDITPLKQLDRLRSDFLGMVGHELRTPLSIIRLAVGSLVAETGMSASDIGQEEIHEVLETVDAQAARMANIISNIRDMAQIEAGAFSVHKQRSDLRDVIVHARENMAKAGVRNIVIRMPDSLPQVPMDRARVLQVLENLLNNAASHGNKGAPIEVEAEDRISSLAVHVRNAGKGIPKERQAMLFQKYSRLDRSAGSGSGLGLVISKGIVEAHGGRIWVDSSATSPVTTFSFTLPLETAPIPHAPHAQPVDDSSQQPHTAAARPRILAVDDEPQIVRHLKRVLDRSGFETLTTGDPQSVAGIVDRERPDVLVLDIMMPGLSGFDVYQQVRSSGIPVIFVTASTSEDHRRKAKEMGAQGFLIKPVHTHDLVASIHAALAASDRVAERAG